MVISGDGSIINLKDRLLKMEKRGSPSKPSATESSSSGQMKSEHTIIDFLNIKAENILAAKNGTIKDQNEAMQKIDDLKSMLKRDFHSALNAHKKADPDNVMKFYPFE